jgi:hypothetical protein
VAVGANDIALLSFFLHGGDRFTATYIALLLIWFTMIKLKHKQVRFTTIHT